MASLSFLSLKKIISFYEVATYSCVMSEGVEMLHINIYHPRLRWDSCCCPDRHSCSHIGCQDDRWSNVQ